MLYVINHTYTTYHNSFYHVDDAGNEFYNLPYPYTVKRSGNALEITLRRYPDNPLLKPGDKVKLSFLAPSEKTFIGTVISADYYDHKGHFKTEFERIDAFGVIQFEVVEI